MTWPPLAPEMRGPKITDIQRARRMHGTLYAELTAALESAPGGIVAERVRRERDICELHNLLLTLAHCQFEGRFLGLQFLSGGVSVEEGQRAAALLTEGSKVIDQISAWVERFPDEHEGLVAGWQRYYDSYRQVLSTLETQLRKKLAGDNTSTSRAGGSPTRGQEARSPWPSSI